MPEGQNASSYILNIINQYQHELYRYCRLLTRSKWDAEDLVQETLMKLFALGKKVQIPMQKAYVFRTATNAWIDMCRKNKLVFEVRQDELDVPSAETNPIELRDSLEHLLEKLPLSQAAVLLLMDVFLFTAKETAEMVGSTEGAVKALLHRARNGLRKESHVGLGDKKRHPAQPLTSGGRSKPVTERPDELISRFLDAFRRSDPYDISLAYMELFRKQIEVAHNEVDGKLYFRFRDPEGNLCFIESEPIF